MEKISIRKNYIFRMVYEILNILLPFITAPYVSRVLGADGMGIFSYTSSVMTYFTLFAALGTVTYGAREISMYRNDKEKVSKLFYEIELLCVITSTICIIAWLLVIFFGREYRIYYLALLPTLFAAMFDISWFFSGHEKINYIVTRNIICRIICIVLLFVLVKQKDDLVIYIIINSMVLLLGNLSMWTYLPKMIQKVSIRSLRLLPHLKKTMVYFIPTIATSLYTVLDKVLIGLITKDAFQNGYYEQANKIAHIAKTMVYVSVNSVMGVRISYLFQQEKFAEIKKRIARSFDMVFLVGFGVAFGLMAIAKRFVPVFFGVGYDEVEMLLYLMSPMIIVTALSNCLGSQYYTPFGLQSRATKFIIAGTCVNLLLNMCMIPVWGAYGACIASIVAEIIISVLFIVNCNGYYRFTDIWANSRKRILAGAVMSFIVYFAGGILCFSQIIILILQIILGILIYTVLLLLFKDKLLWEFYHSGLQLVKGRIIRIGKSHKER